MFSHTECDSGIMKRLVVGKTELLWSTACLQVQPKSAHAAVRPRFRWSIDSSRTVFDLPLHITVVVMTSKVVDIFKGRCVMGQQVSPHRTRHIPLLAASRAHSRSSFCAK